MSQSAAVRTAGAPRPTARHQLRPAPGPARTQPPPLRIVSAPPRARSRAGLMVVCLGLLALGLVGLLLLDVSLEKGTYLLRDQNTRTEQLREQEQRLQQEIQAREAPQDLAARARRLGMVDAAGGPVFVLPNGRTIGVPQRAVASPSPNVTASRSVAPGASGAPKPTVPAATGKATGKATTTGAARATTTAPAPKPTPRR